MAGSRHSKTDQSHLDAAHDSLVSAGARCAAPADGAAAKAAAVAGMKALIRARPTVAATLAAKAAPDVWMAFNESLDVIAAANVLSLLADLAAGEAAEGEYGAPGDADGVRQIVAIMQALLAFIASEIAEIAGDDATDEELKTLDDTMVAFGGAVKALEPGRIGGYLVRFSTAGDPDLTGDYFTKDTDFGIAAGAPLKTAIYFNHRLPLKTRDGGQIVVKQQIGEGTLCIDDAGVLIDAILYNREQYESTLDRMGWSSGTAAHLVDRQPAGKSFWVKAWPLGLDASITPTPAEPRNGVRSLKSYLAEIAAAPQATPQAGDPPATADATADGAPAPPPIIILRRS